MMISSAPCNNLDDARRSSVDTPVRRVEEWAPVRISGPEEIAQALGRGEMVIVVDDEDRENEGDLIVAAEFATADSINFMARFGRGLICLTIREARCEALGLTLIPKRNAGTRDTNFTVAIDAVHGTTTGISAADRATTIRVALDPASTPDDLMQPGHVFPLVAKQGGVLERPGHTEAGCDFAELAGLQAAAVICEIMKDNGEMARLPDLMTLARLHSLRIGTIADLVAYRREKAAVRD